jgi:DNA-directed RNA polymerase specialized sigma24 family protein
MQDELGLPSRLDAIATQYSLWQAAHHGSPETVRAARHALVLRYRKAIRRYFGSLLRDDAEVDEASQDFVVKMLQGKFAGTEAARGRFRDYLKTAVRNAARDRLNRRRRPDAGATGGPALDAQLDPAGVDDPWLDHWRRSVLDQARHALRGYEDAHPGNYSATVLDLLAAHPEDAREQLAGRLAEITGRPWQADAVRKQISRARRKLAGFIVDEVRHTLPDPTREAVRDELRETGLMPYVRDYLPASDAAP